MTRCYMLTSILVSCCGAFLGCDRSVIHGTVVDLQGSPLPGVAVSATGTEAETLTNALGQYTLPSSPEITGIGFIKDGYTSGHLVLEANGATVLPMVLWSLPQSNGVYLLDNYQYRKAAALEPDRFAAQTVGVVYGIAKLPPIEDTTASQPTIICYKMPSYDTRLCRLHAMQATSPRTGRPEEIWAAETSIPVELAAIDDPERLLVQIRLPEALSPGVYAVHWGALEGHTTVESRMFLFCVVDTSPPQQAPEAAPPKPKPEPQPQRKPVKAAETPPQTETIDTTAADAEAPRGNTNDER